MSFTIWHNWRLYWYRFSLSHPIDWLNIFWHPRWHMANLSCHSLINIFESKSVWSHHCCDHLFSMTLGSCKMNPFPQQCFKIHWRSITLPPHPSPSSNGLFISTSSRKNALKNNWIALQIQCSHSTLASYTDVLGCFCVPGYFYYCFLWMDPVFSRYFDTHTYTSNPEICYAWIIIVKTILDKVCVSQILIGTDTLHTIPSTFLPATENCYHIPCHWDNQVCF